MRVQKAVAMPLSICGYVRDVVDFSTRSGSNIEMGIDSLEYMDLGGGVGDLGGDVCGDSRVGLQGWMEFRYVRV